MKKFFVACRFFFCLSLVLFSATARPAAAAEAAPSAFEAAANAEAAPAAEKHVLIVAFGTSFQKAGISYANVEKQLLASCPGVKTHWAFSAHSLLKSGPDGERMLSPQEALARLATEGVKELAVLSLHVIPGAEYSGLEQTARAFEGLPKGLEKVTVSPPLLADAESLAEVAPLLLKSLPEARGAQEAALFVGHGTHHAAALCYPALQYYLGLLDDRAFVGTVEGDMGPERVLAAMKAKGVKKVWLAPLMTVAGDHAANDLFGSDAGSWKSLLTAGGIAVETVPKGLGEYPFIVEQWLKGLKKAFLKEK